MLSRYCLSTSCFISMLQSFMGARKDVLPVQLSNPCLACVRLCLQKCTLLWAAKGTRGTPRTVIARGRCQGRAGPSRSK